MSFYQINSASLKGEGEKLRNLNNRLKVEKENLSAKEQELNLMWEGEAHESFHQAYIRDMGQFDSFIEVVDNYVRVMDTIVDRYESAESRTYGIASNRVY